MPQGDLTDPSTLRGVWDGVGGVFLLPGYDETPAILRAVMAAGVQRVVLLSGGSAGSGDMTNAVTAYRQLANIADLVRTARTDPAMFNPSALPPPVPAAVRSSRRRPGARRRAR